MHLETLNAGCRLTENNHMVTLQWNTSTGSVCEIKGNYFVAALLQGLCANQVYLLILDVFMLNVNVSPGKLLKVYTPRLPHHRVKAPRRSS